MREMKNNTRVILWAALGAFLLLWSCEDTTSSENPAPGRVQLVNKSPEDEAIERGIDAEYIIGPPPPRNGIIVQWHPVQDDDLIGYRVYRSTSDSSAALGLIATVRTRSVGRIDTSYLDQNVISGTRYYYRIAAEDADQEGPRSKAANYQLEDVCIPNFPPPFHGTFQWESPVNSTGNFIFRLSKRSGSEGYKSFWIIEVPDEYDRFITKTLAQLDLDSLEAGEYQWRIDMMGLEDNRGSESGWLPFTVQ